MSNQQVKITNDISLKTELDSGNIPKWDDFNRNDIDDDQIPIMINTLNESIKNSTDKDKIENFNTLIEKLSELSKPSTQIIQPPPQTQVTPPKQVQVNGVEVSSDSNGAICVKLPDSEKDRITEAFKGGKRSRSKNAKSKSKSTQKKNKKGSKRQGKYKKNGGRSNKNNQ
jgi:hypothetical protein